MKRSYEPEFEAFVRTSGDRLHRVARRLIPDAGEAEDALQTALLRLTVHWPKQHPEAYVRATLVNLAKDRSRRRHLVAVPSDISREVASVDVDHADTWDSRARLDAVLVVLPPRQRVTVVLRVLEGLTEAETAEVMGCSQGTVKSNLSRGLDKVRLLLTSPIAVAEEIQ